MALFEVQRLVLGWSSLRNVQTLRDLLKNDNDVKKVWLLPGHVVVGCPSNESDGCTVYLFDQVPFSASSDIADPLALTSQLRDVVILDELHIGLVCAIGTVYVMRFSREGCRWEDCGSFQLGSAGIVSKAVMSRCGQLVYLVRQQSECDWCYSVHVDTLHQVNNLYQVSEHIQLLSNCPPMEFFTVSNGLWFLPESAATTPSNLMMYYGNKNKFVQVHLFRCSKEGDCIDFEKNVAGVIDFRELCRKIAWKVRKALDSDTKYIVSVCVHSVSLDLLVLMNCGRIYQMRQTNGYLQRKCLVVLKDFIDRYPSPKPWFALSLKAQQRSSIPPLSLQLFVCHTYYGICFHGELRIYDSATGEFVWECDDLDHTSTRMIKPITATHTVVPLPVALLNQSGVYLLRCKRIVDHANMFVDSLFPIATNADETTPGDYLKDGELYAALTCDMWGLSVLASHYTIVLAYRLLKGENSDCVVPSLQPEMLNQLGRLFTMSPTLCVALMAQYPVCHKFLVEHLEHYFSEVTESRSDILTSLESEAIPLLKQYLELSQQYEVLLTNPTLPVDSVCSVRTRVREIMEASQQSAVSSCPIIGLRAEFSYLCSSDPSESLKGIKDFMNVEGSFADSLKEGLCSPDINWRNIFASEVAEKASQTLLKSTIQPFRLPVFETLCNLLYHLEPKDLVHFVAYTHMVRESQHGEASFIRRTLKKKCFYQRAVESVPRPNERSTDNQLRSYSELCLLSDNTNAEIEVVNVLLKSKMWDDVISVLKGIKAEASPHLFNALFHRSMVRFSEAGVLHLYLNQLWGLLPKNFSALDFIDILKLFKHEENEVLASSEQLSIAEISPYILHLLAQESKQKTFELDR